MSPGHPTDSELQEHRSRNLPTRLVRIPLLPAAGYSQGASAARRNPHGAGLARQDERDLQDGESREAGRQDERGWRDEKAQPLNPVDEVLKKSIL